MLMYTNRSLRSISDLAKVQRISSLLGKDVAEADVFAAAALS